MVESGADNETVEDFNEDGSELEKLRSEIRVQEAKEKEATRKKKLAEQKAKNG